MMPPPPYTVAPGPCLNSLPQGTASFRTLAVPQIAHGEGEPFLRAYSNEICVSRDDFLPLQMVTIWLLKVPPSSVTTIPNLVDEIRNWMPALDARSVLRVTPWMFLAN